MIASDSPLDAERLAVEIAERSWRQRVVADPAAVDEFVGDASILRDDFAPVDQLISQPDF
jgi:hypothetical protein